MIHAKANAAGADSAEDDYMRRKAKGLIEDAGWLLPEMAILLAVVFIIFVIWYGSGGSPQKVSCSLCKDSCPAGFEYAADCTMDGSACGQCKPNGKTCSDKTAEEWVAGGSCSTSKRLAQCVKRTACPNSCNNGECS